MEDLRGGDRPTQPPDRPGHSDGSGDRPRIPKPEPGTNRDPATIQRVMRASENPAFADPRYEPRARSRVETRYVTNADAATARDPSKPVFYETSKERPERKPEADKPDAPTARGVDAKKPADAPAKSKFQELNEISMEEIEDIHDISESVTDTVDQVLDPPKPTGQHIESRPHDLDSLPHAYMTPHGVELGAGVAAMLCTGLFLGEAARLTYRKAAEMREARHARNR